MKILYIAPHLSTGGMPEYLRFKIKHFCHHDEENDVFCVEWNDITGGKYVVQKNEIKNLLKDNLFTLNFNEDEKEEFLLNLIDFIGFDVVHFEEIPETFLSNKLLNKIYNKNRNFIIHIY